MASKSKKIFDGRLIHLSLDEVLLPTGRTMTLEVIRGVRAAAVVPFTGGGDQVLLLRQFRPTINQWVWEIPAGMMEPGEDPESCARRELEEETGWAAKTFEKIVTFYPAMGYSDEVLHLFKAVGLTPGRKKLDSSEVIEEKFFTRNQILEMVRKKEITDPKTLIGVLYTFLL